MKLFMSSHAKPYVAAVPERFRYFLKSHHLFIEFHTLPQVAHVKRVVIEFRRSRGGLRKCRYAGEQSQGQNVKQPHFRHSDASYNAQTGYKTEKSVTLCIPANPTDAAGGGLLPSQPKRGGIHEEKNRQNDG